MTKTNSSDSIKSRAQQLEEMAEKQAGTGAINNVMQKHLQNIEDLRKRFPLDNIDLLSSNIASKRGVIGDVSAEVSALHRKIRFIIEEVASTIENRKYKSSEEAISKIPLSFNERAKANALLSADKERLISCQSLNIAVGIFSELNQLIKHEIEESEEAGDGRREVKLLFGNAILVYELTDFIIEYIKDFKIQGIDKITELHAESKERNLKIKADLEKLRHMAQMEGVNQATREATLSEVIVRKKAIDMINSEWDKYIQHNKKVQQELDSVGGNLPTLRVIRESAKNQLDVLEALQVLRIVNNSLVVLQDAFKTLEGMELVSLSPDRVSRLLGMNLPNT